MSAVKYFQLTNSTETLSKKFKVLQSGYTPAKEKAGSVRKTLKGQYDIAMGGIYARNEFVVKVRETEDEVGYGTKADLDTFFSYNKPNGSPSNKITYQDHFGAEKIVVLVGDFTPLPLGVALEGLNAFYIIRITMLILSEVS